MMADHSHDEAPAAAIPSRTEGERRAYISGYVEAINTIHERGLRAATVWLREMAVAEQMLDDWQQEVHEGEERCVYCGEWRSPDEFEDGLRCKHCAEADDAEATS